MAGLISFNLETGQFWHESERSTIEQAAIDLGKAIVRESDRVIENFPQTRELLHPNGRDAGGPTNGSLEPGDAFLKVFGRPVTFLRRSIAARNPNTWGFTLSRGEIWIFKNAPHSAGSAAAVGNRPEFSVHELGHAFENVIFDAIGRKKGRESLTRRFLVRRDRQGPPIDDGFFQPFRFQQSQSLGTGEIFADMFIGWVYDRWRTTDGSPDSPLTPLGAERKKFMDDIMIELLQAAIVHNS